MCGSGRCPLVSPGEHWNIVLVSRGPLKETADGCPGVVKSSSGEPPSRVCCHGVLARIGT